MVTDLLSVVTTLSLSLTGASQQAAGDGAKCEYPGFLAKVVTDLLSTVATLSQEGHMVKVAAGNGM
jgi:hypothetical protein